MLNNSPVARNSTPEDIAGLVDFLLSPCAGFLTGLDIMIDGSVIVFLKSSGLI